MSMSEARTHEEVARFAVGTVLLDADGCAWQRGTGSWVSTLKGEGEAYVPEWGQYPLRLPARILFEGKGKVSA